MKTFCFTIAEMYVNIYEIKSNVIEISLIWTTNNSKIQLIILQNHSPAAIQMMELARMSMCVACCIRNSTSIDHFVLMRDSKKFKLYFRNETLRKLALVTQLILNRFDYLFRCHSFCFWLNMFRQKNASFSLVIYWIY